MRSEQRFQEKLYQLKHMQTGMIRIGAFTSLSCHWLPQRLKAFNTVCPNIRYELKLGDSAQIADWTRNDKIDLGLVTDPQAANLEYIHLMEDTFSVILPQGHPLAQCAALSLDQLRQERFIFLEPEDNQAVEDWMAHNGFLPHIQYRVKDDYTIMALVENGLGISILPNLVLSRMPYRVHAVGLQPPLHAADRDHTAQKRLRLPGNAVSDLILEAGARARRGARGVVSRRRSRPAAGIIALPKQAPQKGRDAELHRSVRAGCPRRQDAVQGAPRPSRVRPATPPRIPAARFVSYPMTAHPVGIRKNRKNPHRLSFRSSLFIPQAKRSSPPKPAEHPA